MSKKSIPSPNLDIGKKSPNIDKSSMNINNNINKKKKIVKKNIVKKVTTKNVFQKMKDAKKKYEQNPGDSNTRNAFYDNVIRISSNIEEEPFKRKEPQQDWSVYKTEDEYEKSMKSSIDFSKKYTKKQKESFDTLVYHHNADGVMAAYIAWDYLTDGGKNNVKLTLVATLPDFRSRGGVSENIKKIENFIKDKNVFMVDLSYNKETMEYVKGITKEFVSIDNHRNPEIQGVLEYAYITDDIVDQRGKTKSAHAACAATWKFFYPDKPVHFLIQSIDSADVKLYLKYLPEPDAIIMAMDVQFIKNQKKQYYKNKEQLFKDLHTFITKGSAVQNMNFLTVVGQIMNRYAENMKSEIATKAQPGKFIGKDKTYNVYILNYAQPGLLKRVGKNIAENHRDADFAVLWFYDFGRKQFEINLISSHRPEDNKQSVREIAIQFGGGGEADSARFSYKGNMGVLEKILQ